MGDVGARDQEDETHRADQDQEPRPVDLDQRVAHRHGAEAPRRPPVGVPPGELRGDPFQLALDLRRVPVRSRHDDVPAAGRGAIRIEARHRHPQDGQIGEERVAVGRREDAHDLPRLVLELDRAAHRVGIPAQVALPEPPGEHHHPMLAFDLLARERAAQLRSGAGHLEPALADLPHQRVQGPRGVRHRFPRVAGLHDLGEAVRVVDHRLHLDLDQPLAVRAQLPVDPEDLDPGPGIAEVEGLEQEGPNETEDQSSAGDAETEDQDRDRGRPDGSEVGAESEAQVGQHADLPSPPRHRRCGRCRLPPIVAGRSRPRKTLRWPGTPRPTDSHRARRSS